MPILPFFGGPCRQLVKFDGLSLDLSGLGLAGAGPLKFDLGRIQVKRELIQVASEIAQLLDAAQYSNCIKIEQTPKNSPERIRLIYEAMESERQLVQLALLTKLIVAQPNSEHLQKAIVDWIASHATRARELSVQVQETVTKRGLRVPAPAAIGLSFEKAEKAEPLLSEAIRRNASFNMESALATPEDKQRTR